MIKTGNDWDELLAGEWDKACYDGLRSFLLDEYSHETVYPAKGDIFNALKLTAYEDVKAVILGQDPYHEPGQAQGLAFSVPRSVQAPPSLVNIMRELEDDLGPGMAGGSGTAESISEGPADDGILVPWAKQGVLLLNTVLTVRAHRAGSHRSHGWEQFTDRIIELLASRTKPMVFILWGANAGAKTDLILQSQQEKLRHLIIRAPHPSPLSAYRGFFGGRYFSRCNYFLEDNGIAPIDWHL
ncbi:MAG: uracil-DNA glycosylase [Mogibacterium sp.]|nr:uracil-DNA glycosylase [Mogibacterium sp.]